MFFPCEPSAMAALARRDKRLGRAMERIGPIAREVEPDFFRAATHSIIGQQISGAAQRTVWERFQAIVGEVTPRAVLACDAARLQGAGLSHRKVGYITALAGEIASGALDVPALAALPDAAVVRRLVRLKGMGQWTAEMLLIFCFCRPDVLSYGDFGIRRGLRMLYGHTELPRERFERYARRYSPHGSLASLYLWAIAGGALPELHDKGR